MRIKGSGSGFFGFGGGGSRSDSFKHGRKVGQKVRGKVLKWVSQDMAWVEIDGHRLLAQLQSKPPVGAHLTFIIKQLHPEIILKEVFEASSAGVGALTLAGDFETARTLFENQFRPLAKSFHAISRSDRLQVFIQLLSTHTKLLTTYLDTYACLKAINQALGASLATFLFYKPWLIPEGRRHIGRQRPKNGSSDLLETVVEFDLNVFGMVRTEFLFKAPDTSYRLKLQHASKGIELKQYLTTRKHIELEGKIQCLGIVPLPQREHGGILAELMVKR